MRRLLSATVAAALACAPASSSVLPPPQLVAYTTTAIWLRAAPALDAHRLALLPQGTAVRVDRCASTSCEVQFQTLRGYVPEEVLALEAAGTIEGGLGYVNSEGHWIPSPARTADGQAPLGATAQCQDGAYSFSQSRSGTCSWHGGVGRWLWVGAGW